MQHIPVMLPEVMEGLALFPGAVCIDGTLGGAGHAEAMLEVSSPSGRLLGLDLDPAAIVRGQSKLARFDGRAVLVQASFRRMAEVAPAYGFSAVDAILLDLGMSSFQLGEPERGFSFLAAGPLDMRMDPDSSLTAADIVNDWSQEEIADVIYRYGEEPRSRRVARAIVAARPITTTVALAEVVSKVLGGHQGRIHPATRVFQALRIAVNDELGALQAVLPQMVDLLAPGGRFAVITFHSLEDRIVKRFIQQETRDCLCPPDLPVCRCGHHATLRVIARKPLRPGAPETDSNPRSRSAKLRIAERLGVTP